MFSTLRAKLRRGEGASAVEYAILIAAISAIIVAIVFVLGGRVKSAFSKTNSCISAQGSTTACGGASSSSGNSGGSSNNGGGSRGGNNGGSNGGDD